MTTILNSVRDTILGPFIKRATRQQVAALCYRGAGDGKEILLVTSRDTGRWIIPKGWPIRGKNGPQSAMQEAWEEAGVREGTSVGDAIGTYTYEKRQDNGTSFPVETKVYPVSVEKIVDKFPEAKQRKRKWFRPTEAAKLVDEPELREILRTI